MLMLSRSYRVTFGHNELHLPISFPLSRASEVFLQDKTVLNRINDYIQDTVVNKQANRRPDVIPQVIYQNKADPWGTSDNTGTRSEA